MTKSNATELTVCELSNNYTTIISREICSQHKQLNWGNNGIGDRWCGKKFNYSVIYGNKRSKTYSENDCDIITDEILDKFDWNIKKTSGIVGIFVYSVRQNVDKRPIRADIHKETKTQCCVSCGTRNEIVTDHKNDLYNDARVLESKTQVLDDFQPLCNHCNLQKRQVSKVEVTAKQLYSAKNLHQYRVYPFEFPWEKRGWDETDITCKRDSYWYDPVEFNRKIAQYMEFVLPIVKEIKRKNKHTHTNDFLL